MSLAFRLDTTEYAWWGNLVTWLSQGPTAPTDNTASGSIFLGEALVTSTSNRFNGGGVTLPTGEYIIRDGYYHNGYFLVVGSYEVETNIQYNRSGGLPPINTGFFKSWDGFVMMFRGHTNEQEDGIPSPNIKGVYSNLGSYPDIAGLGAAPDVASFVFFPMRFPWIQTQCGLLTLTQAQLEDSNQGLYGIRPYKDGSNIQVTEAASQNNIVFDVCGYHNIPNVGTSSSLSTIAGLESKPYWATINFTVVGLEFGTQFQEIVWESTDSIEMCWGGANTQQPLDDDGIDYGKFGTVRSIDQVATVANANIAADEYFKERWNAGRKPDGTNPFTGEPATPNQQAYDNGYIQTKFLGMDNFSESYNPIAANKSGTFDLMVGEAALYTVATGVLETTVPTIAMLNLTEGDRQGFLLNEPIYDYQAPWMIVLPAWKSPTTRGGGVGDALWEIEDEAGLPSPVPWANAYAVEVMPPAEIVGTDAVGGDTQCFIGVNNVSATSTTSVIQVAPIAILTDANGVTTPWAGPATSFTTATGIPLPNTIKTKCQQVRTFTVAEENISKGFILGEVNENTGTPIGYILDLDTREYVGVIGNYPRLPTNPTDSVTFVGPGTASKIGFAFAGANDPAGAGGPALITYDTNFTTVTNAFPNTTNESIVLNAGPGLNNAALSGTATDRVVVSGRWDNDRDQWLITTNDAANGWSIISVESTFETFLDQTPNFKGVLGDKNAAMYFPITMSNSLDGVVLFGVLENNAYGKTGIRTTTPTEFATSVTFGRTYATNANFQMFRIKGSTGRTARVWIDYMLYDGVDSLIAMQLADWGLRVSVENVEWFKARLLQGGDLKAKAEEIETWMELQGQQYQDMLKKKERQGRLRRRRSQITAYEREVGDLMAPDTIDKEIYEFVPKGASVSLRKDESGNALLTPPPTSIEAMVERDYRAGFNTTPSGVLNPGEQPPEMPGEAAGAFLDTGDAPKKQPGEGGDPDEEYVGEDGG